LEGGLAFLSFLTEGIRDIRGAVKGRSPRRGRAVLNHLVNVIISATSTVAPAAREPRAVDQDGVRGGKWSFGW
jgi:hypothetical protein